MTGDPANRYSAPPQPAVTIAEFDRRTDAARARQDLVDARAELGTDSVRLLDGGVLPAVAAELRDLPAHRTVDVHLLRWIGFCPAVGLVAGLFADALGVVAGSSRELQVGGVAGLALGSLGALLTFPNAVPADRIGRALEQGKAVLTVRVAPGARRRSAAIMRRHSGRLLAA